MTSELIFLETRDKFSIKELETLLEGEPIYRNCIHNIPGDPAIDQETFRRIRATKYNAFFEHGGNKWVVYTWKRPTFIPCVSSYSAWASNDLYWGPVSVLETAPFTKKKEVYKLLERLYNDRQ